MIDIEVLDKSKTYIGLQYGNSRIAKKIKKYTKIYCPNSKKIPTHIMALVFRLGEWWVYESHLQGSKKLGIPSGVRRYKMSLWLEKEKINEYKFYPLKVSLKKLEHYIGQSYGTGDIMSLFLAALFHTNGKQKDREGLICSEYIALCIPAICKYLSLPAWCITPAHFQSYIDELGIADCELNRAVDKVNQRNEVELCEPVCDTAKPLAKASNQAEYVRLDNEYQS